MHFYDVIIVLRLVVVGVCALMCISVVLSPSDYVDKLYSVTVA